MNEEKNFIPCNDSINDHYDIWRQPYMPMKSQQKQPKPLNQQNYQ